MALPRRTQSNGTLRPSFYRAHGFREVMESSLCWMASDRPRCVISGARRFGSLATLGVALIAGSWTPAVAASVDGAAGFEYSDGPAHQITRSYFGAAVLDLGAGTDAMLAALRFDDSGIGPGWGATAGLGLPLAEYAQVRGWVTRLTGDGDFRAWRFKGGPQFHGPAGARVGFWFSHYRESDSLTSTGGILETSVPVRDGLTARLGASIATLPRELRSLQASVGLSWITISHLELSGEVGIAENGSITSMGPISRGLTGQIFGNGSGSESRRNEVSSTALLGVRVLFP